MGPFEFWCGGIILTFAISVGFGLGYGRWRYKKAAELHACTKVPPENDAKESAKRIGSFLSKRAWVCNMRLCHNSSIAGFNTTLATRIFDGCENNVIQFICTVIISQN